MLLDSIQQTSRETIPPKHRIAKNKWMTDEIQKLMDETRREKIRSRRI